MRVLVTGAGGYIGRFVVKALLEDGHEVTALDLNTEGIDSRAKKINVPIFSGDGNIFNELGCPDVCIHLAWRDGFIHNSDAHMKDLSKHYVFLKDMLEGGLKRLSVMGTMHEIGYWNGKIDENTPCNPSSLYGIAKNALRQAVFQLKNKYSDVNLYWLRAYYILGDDKKNHSIFAKILQADEEGKEIFPFTTGKNKYDFINVEDLAKMIAAASVQDDITGIINCCTGKPVSLGEKVEEFIKEKKLKIKLGYGMFPDRSYDSPCEYGDNTLIEKIMEKKNVGK